MGRRIPGLDHSYLVSWILFGLNRFDNWVPIHVSPSSDPPFTFAEIRRYNLYKKESYKGFMINMTQPNTLGYWAVCAGQIEVHGFIFDHYKIFGFCTNIRQVHLHVSLLILHLYIS